MRELEPDLILLDIDLRHLNIYFPPTFPFNLCQIFTSGSGAQDPGWRDTKINRDGDWADGGRAQARWTPELATKKWGRHQTLIRGAGKLFRQFSPILL